MTLGLRSPLTAGEADVLDRLAQIMRGNSSVRAILYGVANGEFEKAVLTIRPHEQVAPSMDSRDGNQSQESLGNCAIDGGGYLGTQ